MATDALTGAATPSAWEVHTLVIMQGTARLTDDGEPFVHAGHAGRFVGGVFPAIDAKTGVRVMAVENTVRTLLWLDRHDLADVVAETTWVDADGEPVRGEAAGVRIPAGLGIEWGDDGPRVQFSGTLVDQRLALSPALVDQLWVDPTPTQVAADWSPLETAAQVIQGGTTLYDDGGRELLTLGGEDGTGVGNVALLAHDPDRGELVLFEAGRDRLVRGWVDPSRLGATVHAGFGASWGCSGCGWGSWGIGMRDPHWLPRGAVIYSAIDGELIGLTEGPVQLPRSSEPIAGWVSVVVPTPWGSGNLWVRYDEWEPDADDFADREDALAEGLDIEVRELDLTGWGEPD